MYSFTSIPDALSNSPGCYGRIHAPIWKRIVDKRTLEAIRENLSAESATLTGLIELVEGHAPGEIKTALADMAARADDLAMQIHNVEAGNIPVRIAVVGDFGSGKSSFINSVLQEANLCPVRPDPTTSFVTTFTYATEETIIQQHPDGKTTRLSRDQYAGLVQTEAGLSTTRSAGSFTFHLPHTLLKGCELLDTPGFNNPKNAADGRVTLGIIKEADAFLYLLDAEKGAITKSDYKNLKAIRHDAREAKIFLIISKADLKSATALDRIKTGCRNEHGELFDERILTHTTEVGRSGISTQKDIIQLFNGLQEERISILERSLDRRIRSHYDLRLTSGANLDSGLKELTDYVENQVSRIEVKWEKVKRRLENLEHVEAEHLSEELFESLEQNLEAEEIEGSGWFWDDAKIVYHKREFLDAVKGFRSFRMIKDGLKEALRKLFAHKKKLRSNACDEAIAKSAASANAFIKEKMKTENPSRFGSYSEANEALQFALEKYFPDLFEVVFEPWHDLLVTEIASYEAEYFEKHIEPLSQIVSQLKKGIEAWRSIREDAQQTLRYAR